MRNKGRQKFLPLAEPKIRPDKGDVDRDQWISEVCAGFVCPSKANKSYYRVVLEELWPPDHGIPGPLIAGTQFRDAINRYRKEMHTGKSSYKPYVDVFRRVRELQGEEGVTGVARVGNTYQLVDLKLAPKRIPRTAAPKEIWERVLDRHNNQCSVCGRKEPEVKFDQDHKVPRVRSGGEEEENWQPLCGECNNFKSTACRACTLDCYTCPWAFPEKYAPLKLMPDAIEAIRSYSLENKVDPEAFLNDIVQKAIKELLAK